MKAYSAVQDTWLDWGVRLNLSFQGNQTHCLDRVDSVAWPDEVKHLVEMLPRLDEEPYAKEDWKIAETVVVVVAVVELAFAGIAVAIAVEAADRDEVMIVLADFAASLAQIQVVVSLLLELLVLDACSSALDPAVELAS